MPQDGMAQLGQLMNPMVPQSRNPVAPQTSMVAPNAPKQPQQQPGMPTAAMPPPPAMMPQQGPSIVDLMMQRILAGAGQGSMAIPGATPQATQIQPGLQTAPVRGTTPTIGGR